MCWFMTSFNVLKQDSFISWFCKFGSPGGLDWFSAEHLTRLKSVCQLGWVLILRLWNETTYKLFQAGSLQGPFFFA